MGMKLVQTSGKSPVALYVNDSWIMGVILISTGPSALAGTGFERWSSYWLRAIDEQGPLPSAQCHHQVFSSTKISTHNRLLQLLNSNPEIAKEVNALEEVTKAGSVTIGKNICLYQARIGQGGFLECIVTIDDV